MNAVKTIDEVVRSSVPMTDDNTTDEISQDGKVKKKRKKRDCSRTLAFLLYPDNPDHAKIFAKLIARYDHCYILHDADEREVDFKEHCLDDSIPEDCEQIKKAHYHLLTFHPGLKEPTQLAKEYGFHPRFIQPVHDRNAMIMYLTHIGDNNKHQYSIKDVKSNRPSIYLEGLQKYYTNSEKLEKMIAIIQNKKCVSLSFALKMLSREGLTDFALKNISVVRSVVEEVYVADLRGTYDTVYLARQKQLSKVYYDEEPTFEVVQDLEGVFDI